MATLKKRNPSVNDEDLPSTIRGLWIPRAVWLDRSITPLQKMLIAQILCLSRNGSGCSATNAYLARVFDVTENRMAHMIADLRELGWLTTASFQGRQRLLKVNNCALPHSDSEQLSKTDTAMLDSNNPQLLNSDIEQLLDLDIAYKEENRRKNIGEKKRRVRSEGKEHMKSAEESFPTALATPEWKKAWSRFQTYRLEKGKPISLLSQSIMMEQMEKWGAEVSIESLNISVMNEWIGIFPPRGKAKEVARPKELPTPSELRGHRSAYSEVSQ